MLIKSFSVLAYGRNLIVGVLTLRCGQISKIDKTENIKVVLFQNRLEILTIQLYKKNYYVCINQSHYREVAQWEILMEQELRFGLDLGQFGNFFGRFFHVFMGKKKFLNIVDGENLFGIE